MERMQEKKTTIWIVAIIVVVAVAFVWNLYGGLTTTGTLTTFFRAQPVLGIALTVILIAIVGYIAHKLYK